MTKTSKKEDKTKILFHKNKEFKILLKKYEKHLKKETDLNPFLINEITKKYLEKFVKQYMTVFKQISVNNRKFYPDDQVLKTEARFVFSMILNNFRVNLISKKTETDQFLDLLNSKIKQVKSLIYKCGHI